MKPKIEDIPPANLTPEQAGKAYDTAILLAALSLRDQAYRRQIQSGPESSPSTENH